MHPHTSKSMFSLCVNQRDCRFCGHNQHRPACWVQGRESRLLPQASLETGPYLARLMCQAGLGSRLCAARMHLTWVWEWKGGPSIDLAWWRRWTSWSLEFPWSFAKEHTHLLQASIGTFLHCHDLCVLGEQPVHNQKLACVWWSMLFFVRTSFFMLTHTGACALRKRAGFKSFVFAEHVLLSFPAESSSLFLCSSFTIFFEQ